MRFLNHKDHARKVIGRFMREYPDGKRVFAWFPVHATDDEDNNQRCVWLETVIKTVMLGVGRDYYVASKYTYIKKQL